MTGIVTGIGVGCLTAFWDPFLLAHPVDVILRLCGSPPIAELISQENMLMITSLVSVPVGMIVGTMLSPGTVQRRAAVNRFLDGLAAQEKVRVSPPTSADRGFSPVPVVGTAVAAIGGLLLVIVLASAPLAQGIWSIGVDAAMCALGGALILIPKLLTPAAPNACGQEAD